MAKLDGWKGFRNIGDQKTCDDLTGCGETKSANNFTLSKSGICNNCHRLANQSNYGPQRTQMRADLDEKLFMRKYDTSLESIEI